MEEKNIYLCIYEGDEQALRQLLDDCKRSMFDRALSLSSGNRDDAMLLMKRAVSAIQKRLTTKVYSGTKEMLIADAFASALLSPDNSVTDTAAPDTAPEEKPKPLVQSYADKRIHPALLIMMVVLAMLLLWVLTGLLMRIGWLEFRDIGYIWFDKAVFPLFTGAVV